MTIAFDTDLASAAARERAKAYADAAKGSLPLSPARTCLSPASATCVPMARCYAWVPVDYNTVR